MIKQLINKFQNKTAELIYLKKSGRRKADILDISLRMYSVNPEDYEISMRAVFDCLATEKVYLPIVKKRIICVNEGFEFIPVFSSKEKMEVGDLPLKSVFIKDYIGLILKMNTPVVINPQQSWHFVLPISGIVNVLIPIIRENER